MMDRIKHSSASSLGRTPTRSFERYFASILAAENEYVQEGQQGEEDDRSEIGLFFQIIAESEGIDPDDEEAVAAAVQRILEGNNSEEEDDDDFDGLSAPSSDVRFSFFYPPNQSAGFDQPFAAIDRSESRSSGAFSTVGGVRFARPRFDGVTAETSVRSLSVDSPFVDTEVADFQADTFVTYSPASRFQVQAGLINSYSNVEVEGGGELDVWRSELYAGSFLGVLPWLWLDGSVGIGFADFDASGGANATDETSLLFSSSAGASVVFAHPSNDWAGAGRAGLSFLHVDTSPDQVNQSKVDINARIGRRMDWGPGGGAFYLGYTGSTAIANAAVPGQDWSHQVEAGTVFVFPRLGILRLAGDMQVGDADVENYGVRVLFHLFPNRS